MNACLEPGAVEQSSYSVNIRAANDPLVMLDNYGEGPYKGLLLVEIVY